MGWINKPAPVAVAAPAPVAASIDYAKITEAVRAGFPVAAPVAAKPAPVAAPAPAPAPVKRKVRTVTRTVYLAPAPARCGCAL